MQKKNNKNKKNNNNMFFNNFISHPNYLNLFPNKVKYILISYFIWQNMRFGHER